ncbi:hypothetical protein LY78DRAFT_616226 [Colletotrichum sublineola]|uniref:Secreted protein n=1 Tax=Colletotrichum sublineola TaxID=1173701 RepID=A0A066X2T5_COLSU|nr:hypothetical protein LY78DRAFT_616226 [Colletotrichum sublineola]KDN61999.1 hypothetical protein CSUB01_10011 [Colletotrichum sublineola]
MVYLPSTLALVFAGAAVCSPLSRVIERQNAADNTPITVTSVNYSGDGCPPGTLDGKLGSDGSFDVLYKALNASIHPGQPEVETKCHIEVGLETSADRQLVILSGTYRGHVKLTEGATAKNQNQYKFANNDGVTNMEWPFKGPVDLSTAFVNQLNTEFQSGCNSTGGKFTLIVDNILTMTTEGGGEGQISITELDGAVKQSIKMQTKNC